MYPGSVPRANAIVQIEQRAKSSDGVRPRTSIAIGHVGPAGDAEPDDLELPKSAPRPARRQDVFQSERPAQFRGRLTPLRHHAKGVMT